MANGHGGARPGAGRKKRPLADKIAEDFPGKRKPKVLNINDSLPEEYKPPEYLEDFMSIDIDPDIYGVYEKVLIYIKRTGCLHLVSPELITEYVLLKTRWLECEYLASTQLLRRNASGDYSANPAAELGLKYLKQANLVWDKIWAIVGQNCEKNYGGNPDDILMEKLIGMHRGDDYAV
jgi:hypothetical protein